MNSLIFRNLNKAMRNKISIHIANVANANEERNIKHTHHIVIMYVVILGNINNICGRTPILIHLILEFVIQNYNLQSWSFIFTHIAHLAVYISYCIKFFLYYFTNRHFIKICNVCKGVNNKNNPLDDSIFII